MSDARLVRTRRFKASHHYRRHEWSEERNAEVFGAQTEPHVHEWGLEVHVVGPIDPQTGFCVDLVGLDSALAGVIRGWDGGDLNSLIPEVRAGDMMPTTEALARWLFERLTGAVPPPARLESVVVEESPELRSEYPAVEDAP